MLYRVTEREHARKSHLLRNYYDDDDGDGDDDDY
jgi:hypothetical protein